MWAAVKLFFSDNAAKIIEWLGILGAVGAAVQAVFSAGKKSEKSAELQQTLDNVEKAHEVENKNSALSDSAVDAKLRTDWAK